jgi:hypothetical protein
MSKLRPAVVALALTVELFAPLLAQDTAMFNVGSVIDVLLAVGLFLALTLPSPTGPFRVDRVTVHLIDRSRLEPLPSPPANRELMVDCSRVCCAPVQCSSSRQEAGW